MKNEKKNNLWINSYNTPQGNVDITVLHKDKVIRKINTHNTGTLDICDYLRDALAGDYVIARRPGIIIPCIKNSSNQLENVGLGTALFNDLPKKSNADDGSVCTLTFLIPSNILSAGMKIAGFRLYPKTDINNPYAEVNLIENGLEEIEISSGYNLKVEWNLIVKLVKQGE